MRWTRIDLPTWSKKPRSRSERCCLSATAVEIRKANGAPQSEAVIDAAKPELRTKSRAGLVAAAGARARSNPFPWAAAALFVVFGLGPASFGQNASKNVPLPTLETWMWWNENGWKDIDKGHYDRAEQKFKMAIKAIEP